MNKLFMAMMALLALFLGACTKEVTLYNKLDEQQANEVISELMRHEIDCQKVAGEEGAWMVTVASDHFSDAVTYLKEAGLPGAQFVSMGEVFKKSGMVSSPTEERIRYMYALSQELSATLAKIDGVVSARVHVVLPENDPFAKVSKPSSASVFIKHRADVDMESQVPFIKNLVKDGIEGLDYDKISVTLIRAETKPAADSLAAVPASTNPPARASVYSPVLFGAVGIAVLALAGCSVLGFLLLTRSRQGSLARGES